PPAPSTLSLPDALPISERGHTDGPVTVLAADSGARAAQPECAAASGSPGPAVSAMLRSICSADGETATAHHRMSTLRAAMTMNRSEEHTSELQSRFDLV